MLPQDHGKYQIVAARTIMYIAVKIFMLHIGLSWPENLKYSLLSRT